MKRKVIVYISFLVVCALCLGGCYFTDYFTDEVLASLGRYKGKEYYTSGGFQDYTDYAKYKYENVSLEDSPYLKLITEESIVEFTACLDNFEGWLENISESDPNNEVVMGYDFRRDLITDDDYLYIFSDPDYPELGCYDVYFFDMGTSTLYFFHNNI